MTDLSCNLSHVLPRTGLVAFVMAANTAETSSVTSTIGLKTTFRAFKPVGSLALSSVFRLSLVKAFYELISNAQDVV